MEIEEIVAELHALRKLYALLPRSGDGIETPEASAVYLDDRARTLLKDLLDRKLESVYRTYYELITAQSNAIPSSTQLPSEPAASPGEIGNNNIDLTSNRTILRKYGRFFSEQHRAQETALKKDCGFCQQRSMKRQTSNLRDDQVYKLNSAKDSSDAGAQCHFKENRLVNCNQKQPLEMNDQDGEGSDVLKSIIEAQISVSQNLSRVSNPLKHAVSTKAGNEITQVGDSVRHPGETFSRQRSYHEYNKHGMSRWNHRLGTYSHSMLSTKDDEMNPKKLLVIENAADLVSLDGMDSEPSETTERSDSASQRKSRVHLQRQDGHGHRTCRNKNAVHVLTVPSGVAELGKNQMYGKDSAWKMVQPKQFVHDVRFGASKASSNSRFRGENYLEGQGSKSFKTVNVRPRNRIRSYQTESESESESESEDSAGSGSWYSHSGRASQEMSPRSSYGEAAYNSPIWSYTASDSDDSSRRSKSTFQDITSSYSPRGLSRRHRSRLSGRAKADKPIGRFRRFGHKLGHILHHHHYHHHVHHHPDDLSNKGHRTHLWKHVRGIFHRGGGRRGSDEVKRKRKRRGGGGSGSVVEGLLNPERRNVKTKPKPQPELKGLKLRANRKKRRLHWWQLNRRTGTKWPNAGRNMVKLPNRKPKTRAKKPLLATQCLTNPAKTE